jgi:trehalose 6-phosphate synthase
MLPDSPEANARSVVATSTSDPRGVVRALHRRMAGEPTPTLAELVHAPVLGIVLDLDGTLVPLADHPEDVTVDDEAIEIVDALCDCPSTSVVIASGRMRADLERLCANADRVSLVAEHGAWFKDAGRSWQGVDLTGPMPEGAESLLREVVRAHPGSLVERKTWSVAFHYRAVRPWDVEGSYVDALVALDPWLRMHPQYRLVDGAMTIEVRHRAVHKGRAMLWVHASLPEAARVLVLGDDATDEDAFDALGPNDLGIAVGPDLRPTHASGRLAGVAECRALLRAIAHARPTAAGLEPSTGVHATLARLESTLVVVSHRLPDALAPGARAHRVGGLVSSIAAAFASSDGVWLGWSGHLHDGERPLGIEPHASPARAAFDLPPDDYGLYYDGFSNQTLWPALHGFLGRARYRQAEWEAYRRVNDRFADFVSKVATKNALVWVHDYQLLLVGAALRAREHGGRLGHFLHVPFPSLDVFETVPWAREIVEAMLAFDLLGFHTRRYATNFLDVATQLALATRNERGVEHRGRTTDVRVFPLGIDASGFRTNGEERDDPEIAALRADLGDRTLVLGVDRLDYTKGIVERLEAFARMFALRPEWKGRVTLLQIAVPSRADVPEYGAQRRAVEGLVGAINGELGETSWMPVRYLRRSYERAALTRLYREARVALVTPLRDGMNLVAKEYVAAQDANDPGVLVLSRFAGAAEQLEDAVQVNPYDRDGTALAIHTALAMPLEERRARHARLRAIVADGTPTRWAREFVEALAATMAPPETRRTT